MWLLLGGENFNEDIVRGLLLRLPELDLVRVRDVSLAGSDDPAVLEWAAGAGRILLTHDRATIPDFAYARVAAGDPMPGVLILNDRLPVRRAIDELLTLMACSEQAEWRGLVVYLPM